jgi:predicted Fe-S protein YdhL (DUF1289 family)
MDRETLTPCIGVCTLEDDVCIGCDRTIEEIKEAYENSMALKKSQRSLVAWGKQKWRTKSGKPSTQGSKATGERYLPEKAIKALSASEYAASTAAKRKATRKGKQVAKQPKKIAKKTSRFRKYS